MLYHSIDSDGLYLSVSRKNFEQQMNFLHSGKYHVISLVELSELLSSQTAIPPKTVVLTFDDGLRSQLHNALPILEKYDFPATFFISTNYIGGYIDNSENSPKAVLSEGELKKLASSKLADIEPHTANHFELTRLDLASAEKEINDSKKYLEGIIGKTRLFFAYPRGDFSEQTVEVVKKSGFKLAVGVNEGVVNLESFLYNLCRNTIASDTGPAEFKGKLGFSSAIFKRLQTGGGLGRQDFEKIRLLSFSLDSSILNPGSITQTRQAEYAARCEEYHIIVIGRGKFRRLGNLFIYPTKFKNKALNFFYVLFLASKIIKRRRLNLISSPAADFLGFLFLILAKSFTISFEMQVHGFEKFQGIRKYLAKFNIPRAAAVRAVSQRVKKQLMSEFSVPERKITVVPIFSELAARPDKAKIKKTNDRFIFLTVGRSVEVKNIGMQIEAMAEVVKKYPSAELWIIGDGPEKEKLKLEIGNWKLEINIKLLGWQKDVASYYAQADAFLLTSNYEGWGLAVVEAASFGLPIIMTDVGCAGEVIINGQSGLIIEPGDKKKLAGAMLNLIEDEALRNKLGQGAATAIKNLPNQEATLQLYEAGWKKAIKFSKN